MNKGWNGILDWSHIIADDDASNIKENKGIAFESVIESLLKVQFLSDYWVRTQETHDGSKDFVHPNESYPTEWLECKNYNKKLSINVISPTLVMGAINGISRIYIYSRSPLNNNALEDICLYRQAQKNDITVYDGELLEYCIYAHRFEYEFKKYFPNINSLDITGELENRQPLFFYSLRDMRGNKITSKYKYELGESFRLNIIAQNRTNNRLNFCIDLTNSNNSIKFSQQHITDSLDFGELKLYTVICETLRPKKSKIFIKIKHNKSKNEIKLLPNIEIRDEPYCFLIPQWVDLEKKVLSLLYSSKDTPIVLYGGSGTGKSSLIKLISQDQILNEKYNVLGFDTQFQCASNMNNLIVQMIGLYKDNNACDPEFDISGISELLSPYLKSYEYFAEKFSHMGLKEKPFLFVIDDVQSITYHQISFIKTLKTKLNENGKKLSFLFALNRDIMTLDSFIKTMCWDKLYGDVKCEIIDVNNFKNEDIINYFLYGLGIADTNNLFNDCGREISPLEVSRFATMLKIKGVIGKLSKSDSKYVIIDNIGFRQYVEHFLYVKNALTKIFNSYSHNGYVDYLLKFVYLNGRISVQQIINYEDVEDLVSEQIFKRCGNDYIFAHDKLREVAAEVLCFNDDDYANIFFDKNSTAYAKTICALDRIEKLKTSRDFLSQFFKNKNGNMQTDEIFTVCQKIISNINTLHIYNLDAEALNYVTENYGILNDEIGREKFAKFLKDTAEYFLNCSWWESKITIAPTVCFLLKKHLDRILSLHFNELCAECAKKCISKILKISALQAEERDFWLCHFYNRQAIALMRMNRDSENEYNLSYHYSRTANKQEEIQLQIIVDDFHKHYSYQNDITEELANEFLSRLEQIDSAKIKNKAACLNYHITLLKFLLLANNRNVCCCSNDIKKAATDIIENHASPYYSLKARILKIYALIYERAYEEAEELYYKTIEYAYNREFRQFIYKLNFVYAHLLKWNNKSSVNGNDYTHVALLALKQLVDTKIGTNSLISHDALRESNTAMQLIAMCENKQTNYMDEFSGAQRSFIKGIVDNKKPMINIPKSHLELRFNDVLFPNC